MGYYITNLSFNLPVKVFKIGEYLAKSQAKWMIVSYVPFALDFYPQRRRTRQISTRTFTNYGRSLALLVLPNQQCQNSERNKKVTNQWILTSTVSSADAVTCAYKRRIQVGSEPLQHGSAQKLAQSIGKEKLDIIQRIHYRLTCNCNKCEHWTTRSHSQKYH